MSTSTNSLEVGDEVRLISGGSKMTIHSFHGNEAYCLWFDARHVRKTDRFDKALLVAVGQEPSSETVQGPGEAL